MRLIDDDFMNACFDGYTDGAELLLRIILNKPDIRVKSVKTQRRMKNLLGRDICLDIDADDEAGREYWLTRFVISRKTRREWRPCVRLWKI